MGIKHFFIYFKKRFAKHIQIIHPTDKVNQRIDTLGLDLNGIFHPAAQKVYKYGQEAVSFKSLLKSKPHPTKKLEMDFFKEVCQKIDDLVDCIQPTKRLLLCVDGIAGASKCVQQRSRRFVSARDNTTIDSFDSNCLTPGTKIMDKLTHYLEWFVYKRKQDKWKHLEIVFSNEKVPGEGEHKIKLMMQQYCRDDEYFCIYGLDADLIMLCLSMCRPHVYIIRDDHYYKDIRYIIDIGGVAEELKSELGTDSAVQDFVLLCFMVGNDFLPQVKMLTILTGGIEMLLEVYKKVCKPFGLVQLSTFNIRINTFLKYIKELSIEEENELKRKFLNRHKYFPDTMMEDYFFENRVLIIDDSMSVHADIEGYKKEFYSTNFPPNTLVETICQEYFKGLQWVCHYYNVGIPNWRWVYPYHYAPFLEDLSKYNSYAHQPYPKTTPYDSFQQLLSVLPPKSASLIPFPLSTLLTDEDSPIKEFYPDEFKVDIAGKMKEWEAIVLLPMVDGQILTNVYKGLLPTIDKNDLKRNMKGKEYVYSIGEPYFLKHKHGTIRNCIVRKNELIKDVEGKYKKDAKRFTSSAQTFSEYSDSSKIHRRNLYRGR